MAKRTAARKRNPPPPPPKQQETIGSGWLRDGLKESALPAAPEPIAPASPPATEAASTGPAPNPFDAPVNDLPLREAPPAAAGAAEVPGGLPGVAPGDLPPAPDDGQAAGGGEGGEGGEDDEGGVDAARDAGGGASAPRQPRARKARVDADAEAEAAADARKKAERMTTVARGYAKMMVMADYDLTKAALDGRLEPEDLADLLRSRLDVDPDILEVITYNLEMFLAENPELMKSGKVAFTTVVGFFLPRIVETGRRYAETLDMDEKERAALRTRRRDYLRAREQERKAEREAREVKGVRVDGGRR